jgi:D-alanyl-D-alanine carboxypeptidase/D-alanyl-D-alanine-endopeptidase (penicillin-binding protein 4)
MTPGVAAPLAGQPLARRLTARLDSTPLDRHVWGVAVLDRTGRLLFGRNADRLFMPASNAKLLVTSVAARRLPAGWTTTTAVFAAGPVTDGALRGDLVLYGGGDPTWSRRCYAVEPAPPEACEASPFDRLRSLAGAVRRAGITSVSGALIGDGSAFEPTLTHPTWEQDDLVWGYAAPVSGLGFNENVVTATVTAGTTLSAPPTVSLEPDLDAVLVENRARTGAATDRRDLDWRRVGDGGRVIVEGTIPLGDTARVQLAVTDPNRYAALAFAKVLADSGVTIRGGVRSTTDSTATATARRAAPLGTVASRPVEDWIFAILNVSQNWYAETLLKHLGRRFARAGSWAEGLRVERRYLIDSMRIDSTQFFPHDGSGLSSKNLGSPLVFAQILVQMRRHPRYPAFAAGLPRSGATGSLRNRFKDTPLMTRVRAKTGSIGQVNTLSGYLDADSTGLALPRPCRVFSVQANHHTLGGRTMIQAIDSVVVEISRGTPCGEPPMTAAIPGRMFPPPPAEVLP